MPNHKPFFTNHSIRLALGRQHRGNRYIRNVTNDVLGNREQQIRNITDDVLGNRKQQIRNITDDVLSNRKRQTRKLTDDVLGHNLSNEGSVHCVAQGTPLASPSQAGGCVLHRACARQPCLQES